MPLDQLLTMITGVAQSSMLALVAKVKIPDLLADGPLDAQALASRLGFDRDRTHRLLRAMVSVGVFEMDAEGRFANNELSEALRGGAEVMRLRAMAEYFGSPWSLRSWASLEHALQGDAVAFQAAHGQSVWSWFSAHPSDGANFAEQMCDMTAMTAPHIARHEAFSGVNEVCDVGGGQGLMLAEILTQRPEQRGVLLDTGETFADAGKVFTRYGVEDRVSMVQGSFFDAVPQSPAYLLKDILHDWNDADALRILRTIRRAATPGARLVVVEAVLEATEVSRHKAISDLQMLLIHGGRQRSREEFLRLFGQSGFRLDSVDHRPASMFSVVFGYAA